MGSIVLKQGAQELLLQPHSQCWFKVILLNISTFLLKLHQLSVSGNHLASLLLNISLATKSTNRTVLLSGSAGALGLVNFMFSGK
jgi:hypothetical protein